MIDKNYLTEIVRSNFPDLASTSFNFNKLAISSFTESTLLPFLVYQNTIDTNHRLIGLFLPETCNSINLVPFYVIMGHYRKALNKIMQTNKFQNQSFGRNEKQVVFNGDICIVSSIDFINRQILLRLGGGREINLPFQETFKIKWNFKNALDLRNKIESFDEIDFASSHNIFTFPLSPNENQYEGVIIFTNTSKFESILRNVKISGNDLRDHLNIQKAIFQSNDDIKFELLSKQKTNAKPVSVIVARHDAFRAFSNIIASDYNKLKHIKTIVIDDFDELILQWEKKDIANTELNEIKETYVKDLKNKTLKDVYLISKNKNLNIHKLFVDFKIDYYPWFIQPVEEFQLNTNNQTDIVFELKEVCNEKFNFIMSSFIHLLDRWQELAKNNYCHGEVIVQIHSLLNLKSRFSTYCEPDNIISSTNQFEKSLLEFKSKWFSNNLDYNLINETVEFIKSEISPNNINSKLIEIIKFIESHNCQNGTVVIISDNKIEEDRKYVHTKITERYPSIKLRLLDINFSLQEFMNMRNGVDMILYLSYRKKILKTILTNVLSIKQIIILDNQNLNFAETTTNKLQQLITELGADDNKYDLLNTTPLINGNTGNDGRIRTIITKCDIRKDKPIKEGEAEEDSFDFEQFVQDVLGKFYEDSHTAIGNSGYYKIFFEDGTSQDFPEHRRFFHYDDNDHEEEFTKYQKDINKLKWGDQIIISKNNKQLKELLDSALNKDPQFADSLNNDEEWRNKIRSRLKIYGWDFTEFRRRLRSSGFPIESNLTIENWLEEDTQRPQNFEKLLIALVKLEIISEKKLPIYLKHNGKIKSLQTTFFREAIKTLISNLHGINYETEKNIINEDLLNEFIDLIEIKKVTSVIKL